MADNDKLNVDSIIARLLEVRGSRPGKNVQLAENEIRSLCLKSREIFLSQPILLELEAPLKICGWLACVYCRPTLTAIYVMLAYVCLSVVCAIVNFLVIS